MSIHRIISPAIVLLAASLSGCGADQYAPCADCGEGKAMGGAVEGCYCTYYCESAADCPTPETGDAKPRCQPFGDTVENGNDAACDLPCDDSIRCPDDMFCHEGVCWGEP